jgi:hypothetical protein
MKKTSAHTHSSVSISISSLGSVGFVGSDFFQGHGYLFRHGQFTFIDFPGALGTFPTMVLESRRIVGAYFDTSSTLHGFLLRNGEFSTIDFPDSTDTWITGISPRGDIVGFYHSKDGQMRGFMLSKGNFVSIDIPGAISTVAFTGTEPIRRQE